MNHNKLEKINRILETGIAELQADNDAAERSANIIAFPSVFGADERHRMQELTGLVAVRRRGLVVMIPQEDVAAMRSAALIDAERQIALRAPFANDRR